MTVKFLDRTRAARRAFQAPGLVEGSHWRVKASSRMSKASRHSRRVPLHDAWSTHLRRGISTSQWFGARRPATLRRAAKSR